jgi:hypothetical protein
MRVLLKSKTATTLAGSGRMELDVSGRIYPQRTAGLTRPVAAVKTLEREKPANPFTMARL